MNDNLEEIFVNVEQFPIVVMRGKSYDERKELLWRCYASNPKKSEVKKMSVQDIRDYIQETDEFFNEDYIYIDACIMLINEFKEVK